jgi:hypothetical protein
VDLSTPFGGAGIKTNVGLPASGNNFLTTAGIKNNVGLPASGNNLLTTAGIGLGISSLIITIAAFAIPFFNKGEKKEQRLNNRGMGDKCIYQMDSKKWPNVH